MDFHDIHQARRDAEDQIRMADAAARMAAKLAAGRLQVANVPGPVLCELKRELARYNMHTGEWKS